MTTITKTPWGAPTDVEDIGNGILFVSTASHGGYYVPRDLISNIPMQWQQATWNMRGLDGWFEEDCDWCLVALTFPDCFPSVAAEAARATFKHYFAAKLEG